MTQLRANLFVQSPNEAAMTPPNEAARRAAETALSQASQLSRDGEINLVMTGLHMVLIPSEWLLHAIACPTHHRHQSRGMTARS
jgi:hypothetical protein